MGAACDEAGTPTSPTSTSSTSSTASTSTSTATTTTSTTTSTSTSTSSSAATFTVVQRNVLNNCRTCHNDPNAAFNGSLSLQTNAYGNLVNVAAAGKAGAVRVVPGNPDASYLVQKLEGTAGIAGGRMPLGGPFLSASQIAVVREWIAAGALNN